MHDRLTPNKALLILSIIVLLTCAAYWPGLQGGFLFDDFGNLPSLGESGPVDNWPTFWRYITSGTADPTGRPLTLLTFLLNAHDWPASPFPFKCTNLALHLINGVLLYALLLRIGKSLTKDQAADCRVAALVSSALWLLHPLLVSTTLYIVQREAMLPATCVLGGLLTWLHGRSLVASGNTRSGLIYCTLGIGGFTLLGILAKANGVLLPLYALLIEIVVLSSHEAFSIKTAKRAYRKLMLWLAAMPSIIIIAFLGYIAIHGILVGGNAEARSWTYAQRLLTEPRVLMDYLALLWIPRPFSSGLFNDQYVASVSLLHPVTTLPAALAVLALIGGAWRIRERYPALALAILFYFSAQLIESTSLPLELYYEHRNYVPALLMFWPLGLWLSDTSTLSWVKYSTMAILSVSLAFMTHARAEVWGDARQQALIWAYINPESPRAQTNAAQIEMHSGEPLKAIKRLEAALATHPAEAQLAFNMIGARCMIGGVQASDIMAARTSLLTTATLGVLFTHWFDRVLPIAANDSCHGFTLTTLTELINAGLQNPRLNANGTQQDFIYMQGRIALERKDPKTTLLDFTEALDREVRPAMALKAAATLGEAGYPESGLCLLDHYQRVQGKIASPGIGMPMLHDWVLRRQNYWPNELAHLRQQLAKDAASAQPGVSYLSQCLPQTQ